MNELVEKARTYYWAEVELEEAQASLNQATIHRDECEMVEEK